MNILLHIRGLFAKNPAIVNITRTGCATMFKESGLECAYVNSDDFTVLVSGGSSRQWVNMCSMWPSHSKQLSEYSYKSVPNFALSLNIPPRKLLGDSEGQNYGQLVIGSFITAICSLSHHVSCKSFLAKHEITQVTQPCYSPDLGPCDFWLFPKLISPLKGKRFQIIDEIE